MLLALQATAYSVVDVVVATIRMDVGALAPMESGTQRPTCYVELDAYTEVTAMWCALQHQHRRMLICCSGHHSLLPSDASAHIACRVM